MGWVDLEIQGLASFGLVLERGREGSDGVLVQH